jgi:acyl carrier protein
MMRAGALHPDRLAWEVEMDKRSLISTVRACLAESLALKPAQIELTSRLIDNLGADSLDFIDILFGLEQQCGI